jgi:hypothetical protein
MVDRKWKGGSSVSKMKDIYTAAEEIAVKFGLDPRNPLIIAAIAQAYVDGRIEYIQEKANA